MKTLALISTLIIASPAFATIDAFPSFIRFSDTAVGQRSLQQSVTISNRGSQDVSSILVMPSCGIEFDVNQGTCFGPLRPNQSCYMNVSFSPTREGYSSCSITISGSGSTTMISASGNGVKRKYPRPMPLKK